MKNEYRKVDHGFGPFYDGTSRILILGSFPSVLSRKEGFYYGNPQNRFWKVISALTEEEVPAGIEQKKSLLCRHHIALWDVIESCEIIGSSDSSIRNVVPAEIPELLKKSEIASVYTNGNTAWSLYRKYIEPRTLIQSVRLPSTSPANASWKLDRLILFWRDNICMMN